jgi:fimbrial chaperone protein
MMRLRRVLAAAMSLSCLPWATAAATLEISPVSINLAPGQHVTTIEVTNRGAAPVAIQIRPYAWTQAGDADVLAPTRDIVLSPPIFTVPAGASQTIRLLLRGGTGVAAERNYRLQLDEAPPVNTDSQQVAIALRVSLPVMAAPARPSPQPLQWRAARGLGGRITLSATNTGGAYDRVHAIAVTLPDGSHPVVVVRGQSPYVLAGAQRSWDVQGAGGSAAVLRLAVTTQAGKSEQTLALAP